MKHPPYHLRANKAVDRLTLVDILRKLGPEYKHYTYYSLAGPFLEDLRVMDHFFPDMHLVSLESNAQTFKRQRFHQFSSRLDLRERTLTDFLVHDYEPKNADVFWLDYTDLKYPHFADFQVVLKKVNPGSIVRITLRAEPEIDFGSLEGRVREEELRRMREQLEQEFENEFARVLPAARTNAFANLKEFAIMVQLMIQRSASIALDTPGSNMDFVPIQSTRYNDNTQMLSVTGIVCLRNDIAQYREKLSSVRFADFDWKEPYEINIPALSAKERLQLEAHLPIKPDQDAGEILFGLLNYRIHDTAKSSKKQLAHYADYHRDYPHFIRISP